MKRAFLAIFALVLLAFSGVLLGSDSEKPSDGVELANLLNDDYQVTRLISEIDNRVLRLLISRFRGENEIAAFGEDFEASDFNLVSGPSRRLLVAGEVADKWFVAYEHGGRGYHHHIVVFDVSGPYPKILLSARGLVGRIKPSRCGLTRIRASVKKGRFNNEDVDSDYY